MDITYWNVFGIGFECTTCKCNLFEYHNMFKYTVFENTVLNVQMICVISHNVLKYNNAKYTFKCESNIYENIKFKYSLLISYVTGSKITTQQNLKNSTQLHK